MFGRPATACNFTVTLANGKTEDVEAEKLLVAVGRKPNTENIGLEKHQESSWIAASLK